MWITGAVADEGVERFCNHTHGVLLRYLFFKEFLTKEQFEELSTTTRVIVRKPAFFAACWKKIFRTESEDDRVVMVVRYDMPPIGGPEEEG